MLFHLYAYYSSISTAHHHIVDGRYGNGKDKTQAKCRTAFDAYNYYDIYHLPDAMMNYRCKVIKPQKMSL